jgi:hypothetical protein
MKKKKDEVNMILFLSAGISILPTAEGTIFSANLQLRHFAACEKYILTSF